MTNETHEKFKKFLQLLKYTLMEKVRLSEEEIIFHIHKYAALLRLEDQFPFHIKTEDHYGVHSLEITITLPTLSRGQTKRDIENIASELGFTPDTFESWQSRILDLTTRFGFDFNQLGNYVTRKVYYSTIAKNENYSYKSLEWMGEAGLRPLNLRLPPLFSELNWENEVLAKYFYHLLQIKESLRDDPTHPDYKFFVREIHKAFQDISRRKILLNSIVYPIGRFLYEAYTPREVIEDSVEKSSNSLEFRLRKTFGRHPTHQKIKSKSPEKCLLFTQMSYGYCQDDTIKVLLDGREEIDIDELKKHEYILIGQVGCGTKIENSHSSPHMIR